MTPFPWAIWAILVPLASACLSFLFGKRAALWVSFGAAGGTLVAVVGLAAQVWEHGPLGYPLGGWGAPLGIDLYADGLSVLLLLLTAVVASVSGLYAASYVSTGVNTTLGHNSTDYFFWPLWFFLWAALNALFLSADLFNIYVTLELVGLSAAILMTLTGQPAALTAGIRYVFVSLLGSLAYLLGVALMYAGFGVLDLHSLSAVITSGPVTWLAMAFIIVALLLKTGLFPLHIWLPPAHADAPTPVSAILSGLVVKASFYLLLRLWFDVFPSMPDPLTGQLLGGLGAAAIMWGSWLALRQERLKLLIAYSTVAQIGYLFLVFPLTDSADTAEIAWGGVIYQILAHGSAKAAMFLAAGNIILALGHDRLNKMDGIAQHLPISLFAFGLAGISLMGLPPSGGFVAKWLLLRASLESGQWWWGVVILGGGLLAAGYVFLVLQRAFSSIPIDGSFTRIPYGLELTAFTLALIALLLGLVATTPLALLEIRAPFPVELIGGRP